MPYTLAVFLLVLISLIFDRSGRFIHNLGISWFKTLLMLSGVKVRVEGMEHMPQEGPIVIVSNHQGIFDIPALQGHLPIQFRWIAKKSLFKIPVIGWSMTFAGHIPIDRENIKNALRSMDSAAKKIRSGTSVLIFPEGTRSKSSDLLPFKRGGFHLAAKSGVPILPVALKGTQNIMHSGNPVIRPEVVTIAIGPLIHHEGKNDKVLLKETNEAVALLYYGKEGMEERGLGGGKVEEGGTPSGGGGETVGAETLPPESKSPGSQSESGSKSEPGPQPQPPEQKEVPSHRQEGAPK